MKNYLLLLLLLISACTSSKKNNLDEKSTVENIELNAAKEKVPGITMEQLKHGSRLYIRNCSGCHALHKPSQFTARQWQPILVKMFEKSKIRDSATKTLITDYLVAKSK